MSPQALSSADPQRTKVFPPTVSLAHDDSEAQGGLEAGGGLEMRKANYRLLAS